MRNVLLIAAALFLASCGKENPLEPAIQTVRAGVVEQIQAEGASLERYSASIEPFAKVDLAFKSGGIVDGILQVRGADGRTRDVQAGDKVRNGAALAPARPLDYQNSLDQAEARRAQSEAQLAQAQAQLAQARANFAHADIDYARASNLFQSASLVKPQYDQAKAQYEEGAASVAAAEAAVKAAEAGIANARAAAKEAKLSLGDTTLRCPFSGWISARNVDRGSLVGGATVGFSIVDTHLVKAVFAVPDTTLSTIRLGQKQAVMLDALQHAVTGVITSIAPQADPQSRVFSIEVTVENSREDVRPGMDRIDNLGQPNLGQPTTGWFVRFQPAPRRAAQRGGARARRSERIRGFPYYRARREIVCFGAANRGRADVRQFHRSNPRPHGRAKDHFDRQRAGARRPTGKYSPVRMA